ncbi:MAG: carbonic anhydrase [Desulfuromonadaceae bacterium]|nr:carbonic anhydrase [Desulfuromonadaceae bacterium]MDD2854772.1 carbonic anhydrase [Desulfuromonadaceae bacterium]
MYGKKLALGAAMMLAVSSLWISGCSSSSPDVAIAVESATADLEQGNTVYKSTFSTVIATIKKVTGVDLTSAQDPKTVVITCSDSRVPPELIFNKTLGDLFVIRVAGNVADTDELASIDYAVEHLKATKVIVLGHKKCGAVTAAVDAFILNNKLNTPAVAHSKIAELVNKIYPSVVTAYDELNVENPAADNSVSTVLIPKAIEVNAERVREQIVDELNELKVEGVLLGAEDARSSIYVGSAIYDVADGAVAFNQNTAVIIDNANN